MYKWLRGKFTKVKLQRTGNFELNILYFESVNEDFKDTGTYHVGKKIIESDLPDRLIHTLETFRSVDRRKSKNLGGGNISGVLERILDVGLGKWTTYTKKDV